LRIVRKSEKEVLAAFKAAAPETRTTPPEGRTVEFGKEDLLLLLIIVILLAGYIRGQLTIQELLAYLGVSTTGGVWGLIGGVSSSK
jgi:hypothetical protein